MKDAKCIKCRWWHGFGSVLGECRLKAPVVNTKAVHSSKYLDGKVIAGDADRSPVWPRTMHDHWCGEFRHILTPDVVI